MLNDFPKSKLFPPLSAAELEELDQFLVSDIETEHSLWLDALDGYLTAVVIGPTRLAFDRWFAGIWGGKQEFVPKFESMDKAEHIIDLIVRHMHSIQVGFERNPDNIELLFETLVDDETQQEYLDAKMWANGFLCGIELCKEDWYPLFDDPEGQEFLYPIYLLGADIVSDEEKQQIETIEQCAALSDLVPVCVTAIYRFWLPYRPKIADIASH